MKKLLFVACFLFSGIAFAQEQTSPVWPGCEESEDISKCFSQKLSQHVREHYEYPMVNNEYVRGKVTVSFEINEEGEVVVKSVEGAEPAVNDAAREMLEKIPDMEPGTVNGEPRVSTFTVPFQF